ncbi:MAG TPA: glycosyl transferase, partial [Synechococcales bacterium UBA8647]|nr:glycosyl transferase [Synechococcales bacterium UBA8647]
PETWAELVSELLEDSGQRLRLGDAALEVRQRFSEERLRRCFMHGVAQLVGDD